MRLHVPGRIEVLGKHTDYAGGRSLLCAVNRGINVETRRRDDREVRVYDSARNEKFSTALDPDASAPRGTWGNYVVAVARRFARDLPFVRYGADITIESNLPADAGLSSSSALVVSIALAIIDANGLEEDRVFRETFPERTDLAGYLGAVENGRPFGSFAGDGGVGTFGGSEDHTAILCCKADMLSRFSFAPVVHEGDVALGDDVVFAVASSGVTANKTGGALEHYNRLSSATSTLLDIWNRNTARHDLSLAAALDSSPDALDSLRSFVPEGNADFPAARLRSRLDQFAEESRVIVPAAAAAFGARDYNRLGEIVDRSQHLAETALGNQVAETIALHRLAREIGALAASSFGGGFGGSVWALVRASDAERFVGAWQREYIKRCPGPAARSEFFRTRPGNGARQVPG